MSCSKLTTPRCTSYQEAAKLDSIIKQAISTACNSNKKVMFEFNFRLPEVGLTLRAVRIVDGVPELLFDAMPNVPTITEEDVATIFRLVSEGKRPCFYYTGLPVTNPLHGSRLYMLYDPQWLRWTSVGKLLADVDWIMKCLHVGTRSNEDKTVFESWEKKSKLSGHIGTRMDFPKDGRGPTIMSCDSATVEKDEEELRFPEEPKMKITDGCSSLYSEYATKIYQSVGYYDEPRFLKMQEIIKLVLAVEWLYNEKGVRVSEEWVMMHTSKPADPLKGKATEAADHATHDRLKDPERKKPPYHMIPQPTIFERPSSDVAVKTWEAEAYNYLRQESGVERRYGYLDFSDTEMLMFKADGTPCPPQKCLKLGFERQLVMEGLPAGPKITEWWYGFFADKTPAAALAEFRERLLKELPQSSCEEVAIPMPMSINTQVEDSSDDSGVDIKVTQVHRPCAPLAFPQMKSITTMKATIDNYSMLYGSEDPNELIGIFRENDVIIPDVNSWEEFISEMTVPQPRTWQAPYVGVGEPSSLGGVTTSNFRVSEDRPRQRIKEEVEVQEKDNFRRYGPLLGVRADCIVAQGSIRLLDRYSDEFAKVSRKFKRDWAPQKGPSPAVNFVFAVTNNTLEQTWWAYARTVQMKDVQEFYHGTTLACNIATTCKLCNTGNCGICGISSAGLDPQCISRDSFQRFGAGFYLAPNSSKCNDYVRGCNGHKAMLLCDVYPGRKYTLQTNRQHLTGPPPGYDSVYGKVGEDLNYPELVVYKPEAVMPRYIIIY